MLHFVVYIVEHHHFGWHVHALAFHFQTSILPVKARVSELQLERKHVLTTETTDRVWYGCATNQMAWVEYIELHEYGSAEFHPVSQCSHNVVIMTMFGIHESHLGYPFWHSPRVHKNTHCEAP